VSRGWGFRGTRFFMVLMDCDHVRVLARARAVRSPYDAVRHEQWQIAFTFTVGRWYSQSRSSGAKKIHLERPDIVTCEMSEKWHGRCNFNHKRL
jgi:hypothetical protein